MTDDALRERVARAIADQISEGLGAILRKFCDSTDAKLAREHLHKMPPEEWATLTTMLAEAATTAALAAARPVIRAQALEEAAKECDKLGCDPRMYTSERRRGAGQCAAAIRALIGEERQ